MMNSRQILRKGWKDKKWLTVPTPVLIAASLYQETLHAQIPSLTGRVPRVTEHQVK